MSADTVKPLLLSSAAQCACAQKPMRYLILHPKDMQIPYLTQTAYTRTLNATNSITFADLTKKQATEIKALLAKVNGSIEPNSISSRPKPIVSEAGVAVEEDTATHKKTPYATAPITCPKITMGSDFVLFFPDSMVTASDFKNVNLSFGTNYSGSPTPCDQHGDWTLSTFEQVLGDPKLSVTNIPVFDCDGDATTEVCTNAILDILDYAKANPKQHVAMYFAVEPYNANAALYSATQEAIAAGILVGFAAGNRGLDYCTTNDPPQCVPGSLQTGATVPPGNLAGWWSNYSDIVPDPLYGDCVTAYYPGQFTNQKYKISIQGTSFAIPQALAWSLRWWNQNPTATAADVIQAFTNHTVIITKQGPSDYPPHTPSGKMRVVETANYCSTNVSSSTPRP